MSADYDESIRDSETVIKIPYGRKRYTNHSATTDRTIPRTVVKVRTYATSDGKEGLLPRIRPRMRVIPIRNEPPVPVDREYPNYMYVPESQLERPSEERPGEPAFFSDESLS